MMQTGNTAGRGFLRSIATPPRFLSIAGGVAAALLCVLPVAAGGSADDATFVAPTGPPSSKPSAHPVISASGRLVAFDSWADNLVPRDANRTCDVFVCDRATGALRRISQGAGGKEGRRISFQPAISRDGSHVAFASDARVLVDNDKNGATDIFVYNLATGKIKRVSVASSGREGNGASRDASVSHDGRLVLFASAADNLVEGDTNDAADVFVHDQASGKTMRVSVGSDAAQANAGSGEPCISADGRFAVFYSHATNLAPGDTNGAPDIFVRDLEKGSTQRVSVDSNGAAGNRDSRLPSVSGDGRYIAFESWASDLVDGDTNGSIDIFVHDRQTGTTKRVSVSSTGIQGDGDCRAPSISRNGRHVVFTGVAANLCPHDANRHTDIFLHDRLEASTRRVSSLPDGTEGKHDSDQAAVSADGRWVAFGTKASNLLPSDKNHAVDIVVWDGKNGELTRISVGYK